MGEDQRAGAEPDGDRGLAQGLGEQGGGCAGGVVHEHGRSLDAWLA